MSGRTKTIQRVLLVMKGTTVHTLPRLFPHIYGGLAYSAKRWYLNKARNLVTTAEAVCCLLYHVSMFHYSSQPSSIFTSFSPSTILFFFLLLLLLLLYSFLPPLLPCFRPLLFPVIFFQQIFLTYFPCVSFAFTSLFPALLDQSIPGSLCPLHVLSSCSPTANPFIAFSLSCTSSLVLFIFLVFFRFLFLLTLRYFLYFCQHSLLTFLLSSVFAFYLLTYFFSFFLL